MDYNKNVTKYLDTAQVGQIEILYSLRELIHTSVEGVSEAIKWGFPVFARTKDFAYLRYSKKHITLGFYNIDKIDDPDNVLEGNGTTLRHIKIKSATDYDAQLIQKWLKAIAD